MVANAIREDFPSPKADALVSRFCAGQYLSISLIGDPKGRRPDLERLRDVDEVWALCFRDFKSNQWRLLGRFASKNGFVGLGLYRRGELQGAYVSRAIEVMAEWDQRFQAPPLRGTTKLDYLSGTVKDVDIEWP